VHSIKKGVYLGAVFMWHPALPKTLWGRPRAQHVAMGPLDESRKETVVWTKAMNS